MAEKTSPAAITKKAHEKRFKPADDTHLDLRSISESDPKLEVIQCASLWGSTCGMTPYSDDSVAIGYSKLFDTHGIHIINSAGRKRQYNANIPSNVKYYDLVFQEDRSLCILTGHAEAHIYSPDGSRKSTIHVKGDGEYLRLNRSPSDEILISDMKKVYIYDPTGSTLKHTVSINDLFLNRVSATRSGLIVTNSSNMHTDRVTVYDRDGNAGQSLQAPYDVLSDAAVDEQDRVYVASIDHHSSKVVIRLYDLDGLNLKERVEFNVLNLTLPHFGGHLISLSPDMLAFVSHGKLYFIKVSL